MSYIVCDDGHIFTRSQIPLRQHECPKCGSRWNVGPLLDVLCHQVRVGVAAFIWRDGKLLLGKRKGSHGAGTWALPGGHMEFGESTFAALSREVREETGLMVVACRDNRYTSDIFAEESKHYITLFFDTEVTDGHPELREPDKCEEWRWFDPEDLPEPLFLPLQSYLQWNVLEEYP